MAAKLTLSMSGSQRRLESMLAARAQYSTQTSKACLTAIAARVEFIKSRLCGRGFAKISRAMRACKIPSSLSERFRRPWEHCAYRPFLSSQLHVFILVAVYIIVPV